MPINPAIAMSFQAPKFEDPMNKMLKMEQMKAYQQNALAKQIEAEAAQEALGQQRGLRNYLAGLEPGASPDMNMLARFGKVGREHSKDITEAQSKQMEMASKIYKDIYLPQLAQARTRDDVLGWHAAMEQDPRLTGFLTPQGKAMLPKSDEEVPTYLERTLVPLADIYKRQTQQKSDQSRIDAANIRAAAARDAAEKTSQRPFSVGGNLVSPTGEVLFEEKPKPEVPKVTDLMAEYRLALEEGFEGTFTDYKQQFGSKTQAPKNVVLPPGASLVDPSGKVLHTNPMSSKSKPMTVKAGDIVIDEEGNVIYQSEPPPPKETTEERERAKLKVKEEANAPMAAAKIENIVQSATRLKELASELYDPVERKAHPGLSSVTGARAGREFPKEVTSFFSQDAANAKAIQDTIADMIFINVVNEMKALAQTGATGLGSITEKEGAKIQKSYQNLISTQDTKTYQLRLQALIQQIDDSIKIINEAAGRSGGGGNEKKSLKDIFGD